MIIPLSPRYAVRSAVLMPYIYTSRKSVFDGVLFKKICYNCYHYLSSIYFLNIVNVDTSIKKRIF